MTTNLTNPTNRLLTSWRKEKALVADHFLSALLKAHLINHESDQPSIQPIILLSIVHSINCSLIHRGFSKMIWTATKVKTQCTTSIIHIPSTNGIFYSSTYYGKSKIERANLIAWWILMPHDPTTSHLCLSGQQRNRSGHPLNGLRLQQRNSQEIKSV